MTHTPIPVMDYEGSCWSSEFWPGREYEDRAERIALRHLLPPQGERLVEIGAGFGRLADLYRGYRQVILLDYARSMLKEAQERLGDASSHERAARQREDASEDPHYLFVAADLYNLPFADNALDTALTIRVLHHIANIPRAFAEVSRTVRPGGVYVTDFANKRHLKAILKYALLHILEKYALRRNRAMSPFTDEPYEFVPLNFDYHPRYIRAHLAQAQFAITARRAVSTFRLGPLKRVMPAAWLAALDGMFQAPAAPLELAPSLFLRAHSTKPGAPALNPNLWRCVRCNASPLQQEFDTLHCAACGAAYHRIDGIWDFKD